jgi:hypothetical protein
MVSELSRPPHLVYNHAPAQDRLRCGRIGAGREAQGEGNEALVEVLQDQMAHLREQLQNRQNPPRRARRNQKLQLEGPVEGRSLVEMTRIEGMPDCSYGKVEALEACEHKIGDKTIRGPWRFEFDVPNP